MPGVYAGPMSNTNTNPEIANNATFDATFNLAHAGSRLASARAALAHAETMLQHNKRVAALAPDNDVVLRLCGYSANLDQLRVDQATSAVEEAEAGVTKALLVFMKTVVAAT